MVGMAENITPLLEMLETCHMIKVFVNTIEEINISINSTAVLHADLYIWAQFCGCRQQLHIKLYI